MKASHFLEPAIKDEGILDGSLFSLRASFLTCFFGGPFVGYLLIRKNSQIFKHQKIELIVTSVLILASMGILFQMAPTKNFRIIAQLVAVFQWLIHYYLNRKEYLLYDFQGSRYRSPWSEVGKSFLIGTPLMLLVYVPIVAFKVLGL